MSTLPPEVVESDSDWKKISDPSHRLLEGAKVSVYGKVFAEAAATTVGKNKLEPTKSESAKLKDSIIFSDNNCLVINKPSGKISFAQGLQRHFITPWLNPCALRPCSPRGLRHTSAPGRPAACAER